MEINPWQHQIILGCLCGSGYLWHTKSSIYMGMTETHDFNWINYKALELQDLGHAKSLCKSRNTMKWRSITSEFWCQYFNWFYDSEKNPVLKLQVLDQMRDIGFAVWFGDKGYWYSSKRVGLRASKFSNRSEGVRFFNEVGIECEEFRKSILFTKTGTDRFLNLVSHRLPNYMHYRIQKYE